MKKNGLVICGGILEIISGGLWLLVVLMANNISNAFGASLKIEQFIVPFCLIMLGIIVLTPKGTRSTQITIGILNFFVIGLQFYWRYYVGLGILQICLLAIASLLFFLSPSSVSDKQKNYRNKNLPKM